MRCRKSAQKNKATTPNSAIASHLLRRQSPSLPGGIDEAWTVLCGFPTLSESLMTSCCSRRVVLVSSAAGISFEATSATCGRGAYTREQGVWSAPPPPNPPAALRVQPTSQEGLCLRSVRVQIRVEEKFPRRPRRSPAAISPRPVDETA